MCGRYVLATPVEEILEFLEATPRDEAVRERAPSWNIAPTAEVLGVRVNREAERVASNYRWGIVPSWAKDLTLGNKAFNARAERVAEAPMFRVAFAQRRLLVPADAYYEWQELASGKKQPYAFWRADGAPVVFAGLWESWRAGPEEPLVRSCAFVTTAASEDIVIHDRMPVVLEPENFDEWLDPDNHDTTRLQRLLVPAPVGTLSRRAVSSRVSSSRNDGPDLLDPLVDGDGEILEFGQLSLDIGGQ